MTHQGMGGSCWWKEEEEVASAGSRKKWPVPGRNTKVQDASLVAWREEEGQPGKFPGYLSY